MIPSKPGLLSRHTDYTLRAGLFRGRGSQNVRTTPGAHSASYALCTCVLSRGYSDRGMMLTARLHPTPRLRMNGATPPSPCTTSFLGQRQLAFQPLFYGSLTKPYIAPYPKPVLSSPYPQNLHFFLPIASVNIFVLHTHSDLS